MIAAMKPPIADDSEQIRGRPAGLFQGSPEADTADGLFGTAAEFETLLELARRQATWH